MKSVISICLGLSIALFLSACNTRSNNDGGTGGGVWPTGQVRSALSAEQKREFVVFLVTVTRATQPIRLLFERDGETKSKNENVLKMFSMLKAAGCEHSKVGDEERVWGRRCPIHYSVSDRGMNYEVLNDDYKQLTDVYSIQSKSRKNKTESAEGTSVSESIEGSVVSAQYGQTQIYSSSRDDKKKDNSGYKHVSLLGIEMPYGIVELYSASDALDGKYKSVTKINGETMPDDFFQKILKEIGE